MNHKNETLPEGPARVVLSSSLLKVVKVEECRGGGQGGVSGWGVGRVRLGLAKYLGLLFNTSKSYVLPLW